MESIFIIAVKTVAIDEEILISIALGTNLGIKLF